MGYAASSSPTSQTATSTPTEMSGVTVTGCNNNSSNNNQSKNNGAEAMPRVIIFDWDDTICPSSFVDRCQVDFVDDLPIHIQRLFAEVERSAERCLNEASQYGEVIIITNSDDGWVKYSCERYVPRLLPVIERFQIVSARTEYERFYPGQPLCWKAAAFAHEVNELYEAASRDDIDDQNASCDSMESTDVSSEESFPMTTPSATPSKLSRMISDLTTKSLHRAPPRHREILSFGDSMEERTAVRIVAEQLSAIPKSVMFVPSPTPMQLIGQLQMLTQHMKFVCENDGALDLEISPEQALHSAESFLKQRGKTPVEKTVLTASHERKMVIRRTCSE